MGRPATARTSWSQNPFGESVELLVFVFNATAEGDRVIVCLGNFLNRHRYQRVVSVPDRVASVGWRKPPRAPNGMCRGGMIRRPTPASRSDGPAPRQRSSRAE